MLLTTLTVILLAGPQHKATQADITSLKNFYPGFIRVFDSKKWDKVGKSIAPDFVHETPTHEKMGKAAFLKERSITLAPFKHMAFTAKYWDFTTTPAGTRLELSWVMTARLTDKQGKHAVRAKGTEAHTWKRSHGKWLLESIVEHQSNVAIDGKIVETEPPVKK